MAIRSVGVAPAASTDAVTRGYLDAVVEKLPPVTTVFPRVMSTPPTITISNDRDTTTLASVSSLPGQSYTSILPGDMTNYTAFGVGGVAPRVGSANGASGYDYYAASWLAGITAPEVVCFEFLYDGVGFEFSLRQFGGAQFHVMVDGEYATQYPQTFGGTAGTYGNVKVAFATQRLRRISFEFTTTGYETMGIWKAPNDTLRAVPRPRRSLVIAGDSYTGGAVSSAVGSWGKYAARALGFTDFFNAGLGGSGWLATTTVNGTNYNIANRLAADVIAQAPTDVIIALGHNDTSFTNTAIAAQVTSVLTSIRAALPNLKNLIVVGPFFTGGAGVYTAMGAAIQAACAGLALYVDTVTNPAFTGTGRVGSTTGSGNGDVYVASDNVHPTDPGSAWLGLATASAISSTVGFSSPSTPSPASTAGSGTSRAALMAKAEGFVGFSFARAHSIGGFQGASGDQRAILVGFLAGDVITNLWEHVTVVGASLTVSKLGIWDTAGNLLASTADLSAQFTALGVKGGALSTPWLCTADGGYYVGHVFVGSTVPTVRGTSGTTGYTGQAATGGVPPSVSTTGRTDIGAMSINASGSAPWVGWS